MIEPEIAFLISSILSDNGARAEIFGNALNISQPAAVKTGTTDRYQDAWTIGYTPSVVIGVWVGNNDNESMDQVAGSLGAAPIWRFLMEYYLKNTVIEAFKPPKTIIHASVCYNTGETAPSSAMAEYFVEGDQPDIPCTPTHSAAALTPLPPQ